MGEVLSWVLAITALLLCGVAALAILTIAQLEMNGSAGVAKDGLAAGTRAPQWQAFDLAGTEWRSPAPGRWQFLFFGDHSMREFPDIVDGIRALDEHDDGDVLVLAREYARDVVGILPRLGLTCPIVIVPESLYHRYNVRVMPFLVIVDPDGQVQASSLVNHAWQLETLARLVRGDADRLAAG
jgi:hypothetical protein